jgi:hypothetical protein
LGAKAEPQPREPLGRLFLYNDKGNRPCALEA